MCARPRVLRAAAAPPRPASRRSRRHANHAPRRGPTQSKPKARRLPSECSLQPPDASETHIAHTLFRRHGGTPAARSSTASSEVQPLLESRVDHQTRDPRGLSRHRCRRRHSGPPPTPRRCPPSRARPTRAGPRASRRGGPVVDAGGSRMVISSPKSRFGLFPSAAGTTPQASTSPHGQRRESVPRAASSHSASRGSRPPPRHRARTAPSQDTALMGCSLRSRAPRFE